MRFVRWLALVAVVACFPAFGADQEPPSKGPDGLTVMVTTVWQCGQPADVDTLVRNGLFYRAMTGTDDAGKTWSLYVSDRIHRWFVLVPFGKLVCVTVTGDDATLTIGEPT